MSEAKGFRRNDRDGHLDPTHAASLRKKARETNTRDSNIAFVGGHHTNDALAEELAEDAVASMTSGEGIVSDDFSADIPDDLAAVIDTSP
jgi:hypothetical protein